MGEAVAKLNYTHEAVIDVIIANPGIMQKELAAKFGYTQGWLSLVMSSDAFRVKLAARRTEIVDPTLFATVEDRFRAVTERGLEVLQEKLAQPAHCVPDNLVLKAVELGGKALGVGGNAPVPAVMPVDHLQALAGRLVALSKQVQASGDAARVVEGEVVDGNG